MNHIYLPDFVWLGLNPPQTAQTAITATTTTAAERWVTYRLVTRVVLLEKDKHRDKQEKEKTDFTEESEEIVSPVLCGSHGTTQGRRNAGLMRMRYPPDGNLAESGFRLIFPTYKGKGVVPGQPNGAIEFCYQRNGVDWHLDECSASLRSVLETCRMAGPSTGLGVGVGVNSPSISNVVVVPPVLSMLRLRESNEHGQKNEGKTHYYFTVDGPLHPSPVSTDETKTTTTGLPHQRIYPRTTTCGQPFSHRPCFYDSPVSPSLLPDCLTGYDFQEPPVGDDSTRAVCNSSNSSNSSNSTNSTNSSSDLAVTIDWSDVKKKTPSTEKQQAEQKRQARGAKRRLEY
jgi:hypothetical protein